MSVQPRVFRLPAAERTIELKRLLMLMPLAPALAVGLIASALAAEPANPFACEHEAREATRQAAVADAVDAAIVRGRSGRAHDLCVAAETLRRSGDYRAEQYYELAIGADPAEPGYELFLAEYLRNYRGAQRPLFAEAERHYHYAREKLRRLPPERRLTQTDREIERRIERGLVALFQEDGIPLAISDWGLDGQQGARLSFSTVNRVGRLPGEFDEVDDVRAFTSEALFSASAIRLNRALTPDELREIVRLKDQFDTTNRLRLRFGAAPSIDLIHRRRVIHNAQITQFFAPNRFNTVELDEIGVSAEKSVGFAPSFDALLRVTYKQVTRTGAIEFLPDFEETIDHFEATGAVSRFIGPDKATVEATYVTQDIDPDIPSPPRRDRTIAAAKLSYLIARPLFGVADPKAPRFETRGLELYGGMVVDSEAFGSTTVKKTNPYLGVSLKGFKLLPDRNPLDLNLQSSVFRGSVSDDPSRDNSQLRTDISALFRIVDEEQESQSRWLGVRTAFLHLVVPLRWDNAITGPDFYDNHKVGLAVNGKFYLEALRGTTVLASLRYDHQRFPHIDRSLDLFSATLSIGF